MKIITLDNLKEFLESMNGIFGDKEVLGDTSKNLAVKHRNALNTYILNFDYTELEFDTDLIVSGGASSGILGVGQLGVMVLGT